MHRILIRILISALLLILTGCSLQTNRASEPDPAEILAKRNADYFFDSRIWYLELTANHTSNGYSITGEAFFPESVQAAERALRRAGYTVAESQVRLLPDTTAGAPNFAVVTATRVMGRYKPVERKQEATELIYGDPVRIIQDAGDQIQVQSPEGYLCYIPADAVRRVFLSEWTRYHMGQVAVFLMPVDLGSTRINRGSRLPHLGDNRVLLASGDTLSVEPELVHILDPEENPKRAAILDAAEKYLGLPYVWGGRSDEGVDCSGLVLQTFNMNGHFLPRDSDQISNVGRLIAFPGWMDAMLPGDVLFFTGNRRLVTHTGIYMGDQTMIHSSGKGTHIASWDPQSEYFDESILKGFIFARRMFD